MKSVEALQAIDKFVNKLFTASSVDKIATIFTNEAKKLTGAEFADVVFDGRKSSQKGFSLTLPLLDGKKSIGLLTLGFSEKKTIDEQQKAMLMVLSSLTVAAIKQITFLHYASHELRNPLTTINGYIYMLYKKEKNNSTKTAEWVKELYKENERVIELVKKLLS